MDYNRNECQAVVENSEGNLFNLRPSTGVAFFEAICLRGHSRDFLKLKNYRKCSMPVDYKKCCALHSGVARVLKDKVNADRISAYTSLRLMWKTTKSSNDAAFFLFRKRKWDLNLFNTQIF